MKPWFLRFLLLILVFKFQACRALPLEVPQDIQKQLLASYPKAKFRMDGVFVFGEKLFIPLIPKIVSDDVPTLVEKTDREDFLFANGWIYTPVINNSIKSFDYYPESFQKQILQSQIVQEFIIPKDFSLPRDLAMLAGRLPIKLTAVELASERELQYKKRIKELDQSKIFDFFAYSHASRQLLHYSLANTQAESQTGFDSELVDVKLDSGEDFHYISNIRKFGNTYVIERNEAKIYEIKKSDLLEFSAIQPTKNKEPESKNLKVRNFITLADYGIQGQIEDFIISADNKTAYLLSSNINALIVINFQTKQLIKVIDLPSSCMGLQLVSRSSTEPDQIVFFSRSKNSIFVVNGFDYRISQQIDLSKLSPDFKFIPHDLLINDQYIFVATEGVSQDPKQNASLYPKLLILDIITGRYNRHLDLDSIPTKLVFVDNRQIAILSESQEGLNDIKFFDTKKLEFTMKLTLDADFTYSKTFELNSSGTFLIVPSSVNPVLGLVDLKEKKLLKKISAPSPLHIIRSID
ncbi:MAG: hypothetical protein RLZZ361_411 [Cyanobacteriota bacterium]